MVPRLAGGGLKRKIFAGKNPVGRITNGEKSNAKKDRTGGKKGGKTIMERKQTIENITKEIVEFLKGLMMRR